MNSPRYSESEEKEEEQKEHLSYDVTFQYMLKMDARTLQNACNISKMHAEICNDNSFWVQKIDRDFPDINGYYDTTEAKKAWILCTVGRRFTFSINLEIHLIYQIGNNPRRYPTYIKKSQIPESEEVYNYARNTIEPYLAKEIKILYPSISKKLFGVSSKIDISSYDNIFYMKGKNNIFIYLRKSKDKERGGIKRFSEQEIKVLEYIFKNVNLFSNSKSFKEEEKEVLGSDVELQYDEEGYPIEKYSLKSFDPRKDFILIETKKFTTSNKDLKYPSFEESRKEKLPDSFVEKIKRVRDEQMGEH